jgi:aryl-alcohol dehydrogenase-like predicted oxidoreductase
VSQIALAWLLARPAVTSVIFGAHSVAQLEENLGAGDLTLSEKAIADLDAASAFELGYPYDFIKNIDGKW